jgi:Secretion system C-terminal sorting domain/Fibronectin type III domain/Bacterial pre-peptidase C-terminal domain
MIKLKIIFSFLLTFFAATAFTQVEQVTENQAGISQRLQYEIDITKDPRLGYVPKDRLIEAYQIRKSRVDRINALNIMAPFTWQERGPNSDAVGASNGNTRPGNGKTSGRVRAIWEDLGDATGKTVWVGGIDGGLWKTNDITLNPATWTPINDFFGNLAVASICQDPTNVNIMYFGTGEKAINADAVRGAGIWMSTDHGVNWAVMPGTANFWNVSKVVCDASGNLYVGCNSISNTSGLQRYTKATATWTNITPSGLDPRVPDIELSSTGRLHVTCGYYNTAAGSAGYRYTDNPATVTSGTWTSAAVSFSPVQYNVDLASNGNTLYALPSNSAFGVTTIYKSTNGGANWAATGTTPAFTSGQAWYCMAVAVDPNNANNVIVGSLDCYKTTNGGTSWTKISEWVGTAGQYVHADQQIITWRSNNQVLFGCDGGVHYSANGGTTITDRNQGLRIKQFYAIANHPTSTNYFLAGAQDNGVHQLNNAGMGASVEVTGGDGAFVHIDQNQGQYQWGSYVFNQYRRSTNSGSTWTSVNYSSTAGQFINPTDYDDVNNIMYCSGNANTFVRWSNPQTGSTFTAVTMSGLSSGKVTALKVSPYTNHTVYFGGGGSGITPSLIKATAANATPVFTNIIGAGMTTASARISCIEFGNDEQNIIVVYSNYGVNNVWVTSNGGTTWTAIDGNLPDMPVRWAMFYPGSNTKAIIATETGIWQTDLINGASTAWNPETGFPNVRTDMLQYRASDGLLSAATHGRGVFTTIIGAAPSCGTVTGLTASSITTTSATVSWTALGGALNYDIDYKLNSSGTWINAATATTNLSVALSGLTAASLYDYRVRANCTGATGAYAQAQFTTASAPTCNAPAGLATNAITPTSATVSWTSVSGAADYDVDYKLISSGTWTNAATATASTSVALSGLTASTLYDWRVRANCTAIGLNSTYAQVQFTTSAPPSCNAPAGLTSSAITSSSATVSWSAVSGAANYDVDYKLNSSGTWTNAATATASTSVALSGLTASSLYDWRVRANCTAVGLTSTYTQAQFTTGAVNTCPGPLDVSTNGTAAGAATIPFNTDTKGLISPTGDNDYYKFVITTGGTATITLTTLPFDYDVKLYSSNGTTQLAISQAGGTTSETITRTYTAGTYYVHVYGYNGANSATACYTLKVQLGTASIQELPAAQPDIKVKLFPNPVTEKLSIYMVGDNSQKNLILFDANGKTVYSQQITDMFTTLDLQKLTAGVYFVKITSTEGKVLYTEKIIKS